MFRGKRGRHGKAARRDRARKEASANHSIMFVVTCPQDHYRTMSEYITDMTKRTPLMGFQVGKTVDEVMRIEILCLDKHYTYARILALRIRKKFGGITIIERI